MRLAEKESREVESCYNCVEGFVPQIMIKEN